MAIRAFISYSHDSPGHKQWVAKLATDLRMNGVETTLDQWDLRPGDDVARFMEEGLRDAERVVVVCSREYVDRANAGKGGVGYEKAIVSAEIVRDLGTRKFIPIVRGASNPPVPTFLGYRFYLDFEDDQKYQSAFEALLREILGVPDPGKPPLGRNPFGADGRGSITFSSVAIQPVGLTSVVPDIAPVVPTQKGMVEVRRQARELIAESAHLIRLDEFSTRVLEATAKSIRESQLADFSIQPTAQVFADRIAIGNDATDQACALFAEGLQWANEGQLTVLSAAFSRLGTFSQPTGTFYPAWVGVARYPALRIAYAGGIPAVARKSFRALKALWIDATGRTERRTEALSMVTALHEESPFHQEVWRWLPGKERHHTPVSAYLQENLAPLLMDCFRDEEAYSEAFDEFELLQAMVYADIDARGDQFGFWAPLGAFLWRRRRPDALARAKALIESERERWEPLRGGLFGGMPDRALVALQKVEDLTGRIRGAKGIW